MSAAPALRPDGCDALAEPEGEHNALAAISGSESARFRTTLLNDLRAAVLPPGMAEDARTARLGAALDAMRGFGPRDEVEGMLAAQAVALHHGTMDALRRAMTPGIPPDLADRLRRQAVKLSSAFAALAETIERRRNGGVRQVVRIERVVVQEGGQAVVGAVAAGTAARG